MLCPRGGGGHASMIEKTTGTKHRGPEGCSRASMMTTCMLIAALGAACSSTSEPEERAARTTSKLDASKRKARSDQIKAAAASRGVTNALLVAGIAYHESGLAQ